MTQNGSYGLKDPLKTSDLSSHSFFEGEAGDEHRHFDVRHIDAKMFENITWFEDGELNVCYNVLDVHAKSHPNKTAIIWEADEPNTGISITFGELLAQVCQLCNLITRKFPYLKPGIDVVTIYIAMVPQAIVAMLACARLGLVHKYF